MNSTSKKTVSPWFYSILALVVIALATAWIIQTYHPKVVAKTTATPTPTAAAYDPRTEKPNKTFDLVATESKLVSGPAAITVQKGDSVRVNITAQGSEEIHVKLDGYDIDTEAHSTDSSPGGFSFIADKTGEFPFFTSADTSGGKTAVKTKIGTITVK